MRETPIWRRYARLFGANPGADADDEIRFHLAKRTEDLMRGGCSEAEAHARAAREFGSVPRIQHELRAIGEQRQQRASRAHWWESVIQDVRFAARALRKSLGYTGIVVATLALGIGGTTAMFSVVQAVLLAPLPYEAPGRLVRLYQQVPRDPTSRTYLTGPAFTEIRARAASFEHVAAVYTYRETGLDLAAAGTPQRLRALEVSADYFDVVRAGALQGQGFSRTDEAGGTRHVVLSESVWRQQFNANPSIIGTTIVLSGDAYEIVGIAPAGLVDPIVGKVDAWVPLNLARFPTPGNFALSAIGRLRSGVTLDQARAELDSLARALAERWPTERVTAIAAISMKDDLVAASRGPLWLLLMAVGLVLLVVCVNVANLSLVRATGRVRELAIRAALGAGRLRIARQLLVESLLLALLGGAGGLLLAAGCLDLLRTIGAEGFPRLEQASLDPRVLAFALMTTLATGVAFGMLPALRFARVQPEGALREQARAVTAGSKQARVRAVLAAAQLALAMTLLAGAGVLMASFLRLQQVDLGVRVDHVLTFDLSLPTARYDAPRRAAFQEDLARELARLPGVRAAGGTSRLPGTGAYHTWGTAIAAGPLAGTSVLADQRTVSGNLFAALAIPVLAGRVFDARDDAGAPARVVVSASFARKAFPGRPFAEVIGQRIAPADLPREIIGVVGDVALDARGHVTPMVYHAHRQFADDRNWVLTQTIAGDLPADQLLAAARGTVAALDPQLVVHRAAPMSTVIGRGVQRERFTFLLMGAFAATALLLAALGLYGVLAYAVRQRRREIGIRIALGATLGQVRALVIRQALTVLGSGALVGLAGALVLGRWLSTLTFEISPWDGRVLGSTMALLMMVGLLAAWGPARRAARVDPKIAMQDD